METPAPNPPLDETSEPKLKIYFLPNLLTAANLFCGFVALTKIVEADITSRLKWRSGSFCWRAYSTCLMAASRGWAGWKARLGASSTHWPT
jgi:hypothetical protein